MLKKPIVVHEFDTIIKNQTYEEDPRYKFVDEKLFDKLCEFAKEYNVSAAEADALEFFSIGYRRGVGDTLTVKNYVGLIQFGDGSQIEILPKIDFQNSDNDTRKIFIRMLRCCKDFPAKVFKEAMLNAEKMTLYEIFISIFVNGVRNLLKAGLKSGYIETEDNLHVFKGKLKINEHISLNTAHKERFYMAFDDYNANRPENRLIKATLLKLLKESTANSRAIRQVLIAFENVDTSINIAGDFAKISYTRDMAEYEDLLQWARIFLLNKSFSTFSGKSKSKALLFPMESIYESYVAKQVRKVLSPEGWDVSVQDRGHYLFAENDRNVFPLRPDIVVRKDDLIIIMDTKWKRLLNNSNRNYGISQPDLYQMYAYSQKYKCCDVWLLYPMTEEMKDYKEEPIIYNSGDDGINTIVSIKFIEFDSSNNCTCEQIKEWLEQYGDNNESKSVV